ncbi:MAG TPA: hypothetical protein VFZ37_01755 [Jiangellaceae bacterium]
MPGQFIPALIEESMKRSSLVWITYESDGRSRAAWHGWAHGVGYVVSGGPEQELPGIEWAQRAVVTSRAKETRARLVSWVASLETLVPWTDEWHIAVNVLSPDRLNAATVSALGEVWAGESVITKLTPTGEIVDQPDSPPTGSLAARPPGSSATTRANKPWVMHRRSRRSPSL